MNIVLSSDFFWDIIVRPMLPVVTSAISQSAFLEACLVDHLKSARFTRQVKFVYSTFVYKPFSFIVEADKFVSLSVEQQFL